MLAEFHHQFDVKVAFPDHIYASLRVPTPTDPFRGLFEPHNFTDKDITLPAVTVKEMLDRLLSGKYEPTVAFIPEGFRAWELQQLGERIFSTGVNYLLTHLPMEAFSTAYALGGMSLEPPLSHVSVSAKSDGSKFSLMSLVRMDDNYLATGQGTIPFAEDLLAERFKLDKRDDRLAILGEDGNPEFEITRTHIQVGSMLMEDGLDIVSGGRNLAMAHTLSTPEDVQLLMEQHALVIATVVNAIYEGVNQASPDKTLYLWR